MVNTVRPSVLIFARRDGPPDLRGKHLRLLTLNSQEHASIPLRAVRSHHAQH